MISNPVHSVHVLLVQIAHKAPAENFSQVGQAGRPSKAAGKFFSSYLITWLNHSIKVVALFQQLNDL